MRTIPTFNEYLEGMDTAEQCRVYSNAVKILNPMYEAECINEMSSYLIATSAFNSNPIVKKLSQPEQAKVFKNTLVLTNAAVSGGSLAELESNELFNATMGEIELEAKKISNEAYPLWENATRNHIHGMLKFVYDLEEMAGISVKHFVETESEELAEFKTNSLVTPNESMSRLRKVGKMYYAPAMVEFEATCREVMSLVGERSVLNSIDDIEILDGKTYAKYMATHKVELEDIAHDINSQVGITVGEFNDKVDNMIGVCRNAIACTADMEDSSPVLVDFTNIMKSMIVDAEEIAKKYPSTQGANTAIVRINRFINDMKGRKAETGEHAELEASILRAIDSEKYIEVEGYLADVSKAVRGFDLNSDEMTIKTMTHINNAISLGNTVSAKTKYIEAEGIRNLTTEIRQQVTDMEGFVYTFNRKTIEDQLKGIVGTFAGMPDMESAVAIAKSKSAKELGAMISAHVNDVVDLTGARLKKVATNTSKGVNLAASKLRLTNMRDKLASVQQTVISIGKKSNGNITRPQYTNWSKKLNTTLNDVTNAEEHIDKQIRVKMNAGIADIEGIEVLNTSLVNSVDKISIDKFIEIESADMESAELENEKVVETNYVNAMTKATATAVFNSLGIINQYKF